MDAKLRAIILFAGLVTFLYGLVLQRWALARHRAPDSPGPWLDWRPRKEKREWFASDYGYRLYRSAGWHTLTGGLVMLVVWFL